MNRIIKNIPNAITLLNLLGGCVAILLTFYGDEPMGRLHAYQWAWIAIGVAAVADFCDGLAARALSAYSELGKQLDSLSDLVSFGVAPAMLLIFTLDVNYADQWVCWLPLLIPCAAALRLAKFNIDTRQTTSFLGLPVPACAIFWIGYTALIYSNITLLTAWWIVLPVVVAVCLLMVSEMPLFSLKIADRSWQANRHRVLLLAAAIIFVLCMGVGGLAWLIAFYVAQNVVINSRHTPRQ